ncbi:MAG: hypothetical protein LUC16_00675 [Coprobacillus sp.]|nr:hypothetical protein [Coprobacillus sp.]
MEDKELKETKEEKVVEEAAPAEEVVEASETIAAEEVVEVPTEETPVTEVPTEEVPACEEVAAQEPTEPTPATEEQTPAEDIAVLPLSPEEVLPEHIDLSDKKALKGEQVDYESELSKIKDVQYEGVNQDLAKVEEGRQAFMKVYKLQNRISYIVLAVVLIFAIVGFILVLADPTEEGVGWMAILGYVLIGLAVVAMIVQYILGRRGTPKKSAEYASLAIDTFNAYNYSSSDYSKVTYDELEKVDASEILADGVYYDVVDTKSQAVVRGCYGGALFKCANVSVLVKSDSKRQNDTAFLGRYITYPNTLKIENRIIINLKGAKAIDLPTNTFDLVKARDDEIMTIYAKEGVAIKDAIPNKFLTAIQEIGVTDSLLNINIVLWSGHTAVYLTYVDEYVSVPVDHPLVEEQYIKGRDDILKTLKALKTINKTK